jgi:hypothetical protein
LLPFDAAEAYQTALTPLQHNPVASLRCAWTVRYLNNIVEQDHRASNGGFERVMDSEPFSRRGERLRDRDDEHDSQALTVAADVIRITAATFPALHRPNPMRTRLLSERVPATGFRGNPRQLRLKQFLEHLWREQHPEVPLQLQFAIETAAADGGKKVAA